MNTFSPENISDFVSEEAEVFNKIKAVCKPHSIRVAGAAATAFLAAITAEAMGAAPESGIALDLTTEFIKVIQNYCGRAKDKN